MQAEDKINDPLHYTLSFSSEQFKIYTSLNQQGQNLSILFYQQKPKQNKTMIYQSIITANNSLVQSLGGIANFVDYIQDKSNMCFDQNQNTLRIFSNVQVKGIKRQIQIGKVQLKFKREVDENQEISLEQIEQFCKSSRQVKGTKINQFILAIIKYIKTNQRSKIEQEYHELTQPLIKKIALLGEGHQLLKSQLGNISEEISHLNVTITEVDIKASQNEKLMSEMIEDVHQNKQKIQYVQEQFQQIIQLRIAEVKQQMRQKMKDVFRQIDQNYEGVKKIMVNQYKLENIKMEEVEQKPKKILAKIEEPDKPFTFSKILKHNEIVIENAGLTATGGNAGRGKIILVAPSIGSIRLKKMLEISVKFKIKHGPTNILLGASNFEKARTMLYKIQKWDREGHGGYYINSGAYSYSSYREEDNASIKSFRYKDGDIVKVTCSLEKKILIFSKQNEDQKYIMPYDPNIHEDKLYFAVILHGIESKVQIHQD